MPATAVQELMADRPISLSNGLGAGRTV